jgi:hypothetical protein
VPPSELDPRRPLRVEPFGDVRAAAAALTANVSTALEGYRRWKALPARERERFVGLTPTGYLRVSSRRLVPRRASTSGRPAGRPRRTRGRGARSPGPLPDDDEPDDDVTDAPRGGAS